MSDHRILFSDDDFTCNLDICEILRAEGFTVLTTYCSSAAIEAINKGGRLSALVTDIELGAGVDGFEVARRARFAYPDLPVVFISGTASDRHIREGVEGSIFVNKPCHPDEIVRALHRALPLEAA